MLAQVVVWLAGGALVGMLVLIAHAAIVCRLALVRFTKATKGLPMADEQRLIGNGALSITLRHNVCAYLMKAHQKWGKTFGWLYYTRPCVMTIDLELIRRIHSEPGKHLDRLESLNLPLREFEHSIMLAGGDKWRRLRRNFAPALTAHKFKTPNVLAEVEGSIGKLIGLINAKLAEEQSSSAAGGKESNSAAGRVLNVDDLVHRYSLNLVFSCLYKQYGVVNFNEGPCKYVEAVDEGLEAMQKSRVVQAGILFPFLAPIIDWLVYNFHPQGGWRRDVMEFVVRQTRLGLRARKEARDLLAQGHQIDPNDFTLKDGTRFQRNMIDHVIDQFHDGKLSKDEYLDSSCFLVNAADKTAADCLVFALYHVARRADIQDKLRASIRRQGAESAYLGWVLDESMRLMPPANIGASRTIDCDMQLASGHVVPKGTFVVTPLYVIHRLPEYWGADADEFEPERWRDTSKHHAYQYMPFGVGPRACPGKAFALFEMRQLMAALLTNYQLEAEIKHDLYQFESPLLIYLVPNSPTYIRFKRLL